MAPPNLFYACSMNLTATTAVTLKCNNIISWMPFIILNFITIVVVAVVADVMIKRAKMLTLKSDVLIL